MKASLVVGFDLDLTLVDSRHRIVSSYLAAFGRLGHAHIGEADLEPHLGIPLVQVSRLLAPDLDTDTLVRVYRENYDRADAPRTEPMPHAREALAAVRRRHGKVVVVSAKQRRAVGVALEEAGLAELVDAFHGDLFALEKAAPLRAEGALVYVGDHPGDVAAAHAARCRAVGVATGANSEEALRGAGADDVLAALDAFPSWLDAYTAETYAWTSDASR